MPGTKKNHPPCPAEWVGGRRRKLVRRNRTSGGPPRSSTMPALMAESATDSLVSSVSTVGSGYVRDRQSEDGHDQQQREMGQQPEGFEDKMHFYPPSGAVKSDAHASFADGPATASPKLTATDSRKKQSLFGTKKPKALDRPNSSTHSLGVVSPLPVSTPSKAAQFFGIEPKPKPLGSPRRGQLRDDGISGDDALVRLTPQKQRSLPLLTKFKLGADRQIRFREEDNEPLSRSSKNSKFNANKGLRMLIPDFAGSRRAPIQQTTAEATRFDVDDDDGDAGYGSDSSPQEARFQIPSSSRPVPAPMKRRPNKKHPKPLESMSPIPEASFESLRPAYRQSEDLTELGVISEYESDSPAYSAPLLPRSHTESVLPSYNTFELDEEDLSPTDRFYYEGPTDDEDDTVHPGTKVDLKRAHSQQRTRLHIRSPLQSIEDNYLDATEDEMRLAARKMTLDRIEKDKQAMDAEIAVLRREHEKLKLGFSNITTHNEVDPMPGVHSDGDNEDLMSLRSSIDSDEEPTVHEAQVMTFTRITPGMVKLVDIRARKNPMAHAASNTPVPNKLPPVRHETKDFAAPALDENLPPVSPVVTHHHHEDSNYDLEPKKSKMTPDESRLLVQNWITDYNGTEQRPISTRVDPDVLADQETPPAPFPKSDEALPTPPIQPRSDSLARSKRLPKHQCINNGHIFHPIDLKHVPDNTVINSLEVRPYLQTYNGVKQHVKVPVICEKCGEDCDENIWECEIAVCRMVTCQSCAEDMEVEWQERAASGWKYK